MWLTKRLFEQNFICLKVIVYLRFLVLFKNHIVQHPHFIQEESEAGGNVVNAWFLSTYMFCIPRNKYLIEGRLSEGASHSLWINLSKQNQRPGFQSPSFRMLPASPDEAPDFHLSTETSVHRKTVRRRPSSTWKVSNTIELASHPHLLSHLFP